jgi:trimeric autotransporter adhesin
MRYEPVRTRTTTLALAAACLALAATPPAVASTQDARECVVTGRVTAGTLPLPGVAVTILSADSKLARATATNGDGTYLVKLPASGRYEVTLDLTGFAPVTRTIDLTSATCPHTLDIVMTLASRVQAPQAALPVSRAPNPLQGRLPQTAGGPPGANVPAAANARLPEAENASQPDEASRLLLPPGFSPDAPTESVTSVGTAGQLNQFLLFGPGREGMMGPGGPGEGPLGGGFGEGRPGGGPGGPGGGLGGPGGGMLGRGLDPQGLAGFGPGAMGGRMGGNRLRGSGNYNVSGSALDARPYSLAGQPASQPGYLSQRFGAALGGPLNIPKLLNGSRTTFFLNYSGNRSGNQYDAYSTVPTQAMRAGDLSGFSAVVFDPATGQPFPGNRIPQSRLDPSALALLKLYPLPNQEGARQNLHYVTTSNGSQDDLNFRLIRSFGSTTRRGPGGPGMRMGPGGGGRGGPGGPAGSGSTLTLGVHYRRSNGFQPNPFQTLGSTSESHSWDIPVNFALSVGKVMNVFRVRFNRSESQTSNLFAFAQDVAGEAGIGGVSEDPFDWGAPNLSFSSFSGLRDVTPSRRLDQTFEIGDSMVRTLGRHVLRWGGAFRTLRTDSRTNQNPRGSFVFTGLYTQSPAVGSSGLDFADFLLGLPQQASLQYGPGLDRFRGRSWEVYLQDDWRVSGSLTLNFGLRYEYVSPYTEADNRLVNLDVAPDFTAAVPVVAGQSGPFTGTFPLTLVSPDRGDFAPRVGLAWRRDSKTIVRAGYGVNYNAGAYATIVRQLAAQPPFATTVTNLGTVLVPLFLSNAFTSTGGDAVTNSFGIDPNYRLGYVQIWNVDIQRTLGRTVMIGVGYTGTKGSRLDLQRAPNRGPDGLRIPGVQPFIWETSGGSSIMHALTVRLQKRLTGGFAGGATYTYSRSRDDASSIGGSAVVVAQNDQDLAAEWGPSSFDQPHRFVANIAYELPFGTSRRWLKDGGLAAGIFGDWQWTANVSVASGSPFTARVLSNAGDVARGTNGTLRANYDGTPITLADPTIAEFFNTSAFSVPPQGQFGNAGRNGIRGPGITSVNMSVSKDFSLGSSGRALTVQAQATNVFNTVQFASIDTVVNSPTFGRVVSVRPMRSVQIVLRVRF